MYLLQVTVLNLVLNRSGAAGVRIVTFLGILLGILIGFLLSMGFLLVGVGALVCIIASSVDGSDRAVLVDPTSPSPSPGMACDALRG